MNFRTTSNELTTLFIYFFLTSRCRRYHWDISDTYCSCMYLNTPHMYNCVGTHNVTWIIIPVSKPCNPVFISWTLTQNVRRRLAKHTKMILPGHLFSWLLYVHSTQRTDCLFSYENEGMQSTFAYCCSSVVYCDGVQC